MDLNLKFMHSSNIAMYQSLQLPFDFTLQPLLTSNGFNFTISNLFGLKQ